MCRLYGKSGEESAYVRVCAGVKGGGWRGKKVSEVSARAMGWKPGGHVKPAGTSSRGADSTMPDFVIMNLDKSESDRSRWDAILLGVSLEDAIIALLDKEALLVEGAKWELRTSPGNEPVPGACRSRPFAGNESWSGNAGAPKSATR